MLEVDRNKGEVTKRTIVSGNDISRVENEMNTYRGVYVDDRSLEGLLPIPKSEHAKSANLDDLTRPKSDEEFDALRGLSVGTRELLENPNLNEKIFRGVAKELGNRSYFNVLRTKEFTEYRGGMQDAKGRCSDLTHVVPHTSEWKERMERINRGLDAVEKLATCYASIEELNTAFRGCLDSKKDTLVTDTVFSTGYTSRESFNDFSNLKPYDFITIGAGVSDGKETALVYRGTKAILPPPPSPSPPPSPKEPYRAAKVEDVTTSNQHNNDGMAALLAAFTPNQ